MLQIGSRQAGSGAQGGNKLQLMSLGCAVRLCARGRGEAVPDERGKRSRRDAPRGEGSPAGKERGGAGTEGELRNVWAEKAAAAKAEASQEEEFEQYFQDMFM